MKPCLIPVAASLACLCAATATHGSESATPSTLSLHTRLHRAAGVPDVRRMPGVPRELPRRLYPCLDLAATALGVDAVRAGSTPLQLPYTGKGVVIAVIDGGIDPRHIAFSVAGVPGTTRVARYMRTRSAAESESGETEYEIFDDPLSLTPSDIDLEIGGHGTHVAGTAAGASGTGPFTGMAPEAELFLVSMGDKLYDDEIEAGMRAALDYAESAGRPLVMNFSLGSPVGPHKGLSPLTETLREYPAEGRVALFSAGNDGCYKVSLTRDFGAQPGELSTGLAHFNTGTATQSAYVEAHSLDAREFEAAVTVIDFEGSVHEVWRSPFLPAESFDDSGVCVLLDSDAGEAFFSELRDYFRGQILLGRGNEADGAFSMALLADFPDADVESRYGLGLAIRSSEGADVMLVSDFTRAYFRSYGMKGYSEGDSRNSISEYCTSPLVVGVGSWNTRKTWTDLAGETQELNEKFFGPCGDVASYSSYGTLRGDASVIFPQVVAPGTEVISSIPAEYKENAVWLDDTHGSPQYWGNMSGTSMASPAAAGVVALWLEACPTLTRDDVVEVMRATSRRDDAVERAPNGGAFGKLDAFEGLKYILANMHVPSTAATPSRLLVRALGPGEVECVLPFSAEGGVASLYAADGSLLERREFTGVSCAFRASPGIYVVQASTARGTACGRVCVR